MGRRTAPAAHVRRRRLAKRRRPANLDIGSSFPALSSSSSLTRSLPSWSAADFAPPWEDTTQTRRTGTRRSGSNFTLNNLHQRDGDGRHDLNLGHAHEKEVDTVEITSEAQMYESVFVLSYISTSTLYQN